MNLEAKLRTLRISSLAVTGFAILLVLAGLSQLVLGGVAVKEEYERIERLEALAPPPSQYYGYQQQRRQLQAEYNRSGSAFFIEGRFLPAGDDQKPGIISIISLITLMLAALGFVVSALIWVWRAHANIREVGIRSKYGPGFAVASYLIPVANFMLPFEAMRELHNRSHGESEDFAHSGVENVTAWWTAVLVGLLIFSAMIVKFALDAGTNLILMTPLWMEFALLAFAILLLLVSAYLFSSLTRAITAAQEEVLPEIDPAGIEAEMPDKPRVNIIGA
ncbi:DUF4328 domain-containing protein [Qipengyuania sp. 1NDW9]|uniref:DUF4328 domain-containing protein n=1 Tax=Qipengyuania xiapuensis TaxID=2867236 RepID=UPI001C86CAA7|nr:DUF4328 domain-containing protein [Qipengyuania xiapuensis]MBX7493601.1 DUF4328 domain-containing protein [Qipengyuania xiapuensis]